MNGRKVSVVVITYNEELNIRACLESAKWADEIIVADCFSSDRTASIAAEFTDKIFQHKFSGFGKLRNEAVAHSSNDWVFSLDADERCTPELAREIRVLLSEEPSAAAYFVPRKNYFFGKWIKHCGWYPDYRQTQLFDRRRMRYKDADIIHENYEVDGKRGYLKEHVIHISFRNIKQFLDKMERYSFLMGKRLVDNGVKFHTHQLLTHPIFTFIKMYFLRLGFLDGIRGFILSGLYAYYTYIKYVRIWELTKTSQVAEPPQQSGSSK